MAEHQGKAREKRNIPGGTPTDDPDGNEGDAPPRGEGPDPADTITRKKAEEANRENPDAPRGHQRDGGWKGGGAG